MKTSRSHSFNPIKTPTPLVSCPRKPNAALKNRNTWEKVKRVLKDIGFATTSVFGFLPTSALFVMSNNIYVLGATALTGMITIIGARIFWERLQKSDEKGLTDQSNYLQNCLSSSPHGYSPIRGMVQPVVNQPANTKKSETKTPVKDTTEDFFDDSVYQKVSKKIDDFFAEYENLDKVDSGQLVDDVKLLLQSMHNDLNSFYRDDLKPGAISSDVSDKADFGARCLKAASLGEKVFEKVGDVCSKFHFKEIEVIDSISSGFSLSRDMFDWIGRGADYIRVRIRAKEIRVLEKELELLEYKLKQGADPALIRPIREGAEDLRTQIDVLRSKNREKLRDIYIDHADALLCGCEDLVEILTDKTNFFESNPDILNGLLITGNSIGIASSVISVSLNIKKAWKCYEKVSNNKVNEKFCSDMLKQQEIEEDPDVYINYFLRLKKDAMQKAKPKRIWLFAEKILKIVTSTVSLTLGVKVLLVATGVALCPALLTTASIASGVLAGIGIGLALGHMGYEIYLNRHKIILTSQVFKQRIKRAIVMGDFKKLELEKLNLEHSLKSYAQTKVQLKREMLELDQMLNDAREFNDAIIPAQSEARLTELKEQLKQLKSDRNKARSRLDDVCDDMILLYTRWKDSTIARDKAYLDYKWNTISDKFKLDGKSLKIFGSVFEEALNDPIKKAALTRSLRTLGYSSPKPLDVRDIFKFITSNNFVAAKSYAAIAAA